MMALQTKYKNFLAAHSAESLAGDASINYVPTLSTIQGPAAILKHLTAQNQQVKKREENVLNVIESEHNLCLETETTLQFATGGGTYLPGLDENYIIDKTATIPIIHVVAFNEEQKIRQIRLFWDQGSLLKAVEVVGARGRSWPIRDGKDQARLIASSATSTVHAQTEDEEERVGRRQSRFVADPQARLFAAPQEAAREESPRTQVAPRMSAKPPPRDLGDLFVSGEEPTPARSPSPRKFNENANPLKSGAGKHYHENRLFEQEPMRSPEKSIKTNPNRYDHFEFGHAESAPPPRPEDKIERRHGSQWDFSDFATPQKPRAQRQYENTKPFGWSEHEDEAQKPNTWRQHVPKARPDSATHFEFGDVSPERDAAPKPRSHPMGAHLYEDHIIGDQSQVTTTEQAAKLESPPRGTVQNADQLRKTFESNFEITDKNGGGGHAAVGPRGAQEKVPLGNITNVNARRRDFGSHFDITDNSSPAAPAKDENASVAQSKKPGSKTFESSWDMYDTSPQPAPRAKPAGGAAGGRKTEEKSWWDF